MPIYDFECQDCAYYTEITQKMEASSRHKCPHCGKKTLVKVLINPPAMFIRGAPTTIGQMADRNTEKMGKYELQDKTREHGAKASGEAKERRELQKKINSMTPQQKVKWIHGGD